MTEIETLEEFGLSESEAKVYVALLETGSTLAGPVIKKTGLHRGTTYQILQRLMEKGLVSSVIKGRKRHFEPANPERLVGILREKQEVTVYYGVKGIRSVLDKMLEEMGHNGEYYDFGVSGLFRQLMGAYWELWQKRKRKQKISSYVIFNEETKKKNPQLLKD